LSGEERNDKRSRALDDGGNIGASLSSKYTAIQKQAYAHWLYGAQPVKAENSKRTKSKKGKLMGLAYFPPYALRGFDMDKLGW
jgi:hypothetical protein